ncbi:MAG: SUMF1/EgtB/PvdO family nonheme iron enzyme [Pyrinomonadaceae bacterium]
MICPKCKEEMIDTARFCSNCGISFASFNTPTERVDTRDLPENLPELDPLVGQTLDGKYELLARLGEGGMGAVYRARRIHIGDEVALKVLLRKFVADASLVERFRREARAAAALRHPNVVVIYDYGEARNEDAPAYIVMELVEGDSLRELLRREERLAPERAVALMRDICAGVGAAHRRQIFHRDLKPDNVIVLPPDEDRERETVKVVDFGIAKLRDAAGAPTLTQTGVVMGTPHYMSPEQCRGEMLDARADVYSLGAILYEMLAGAPPFTAASLMGVLTKHITEAPPPLPADASVPPALDSLIMRALAKDPAARPANATELSRELRAAEEETSRQREAEAQRQRKEEQHRRQAEQAARAAEEERQRKEAEERKQRETDPQRRREAEAVERQRVAEHEAAQAKAKSADAAEEFSAASVEPVTHVTTPQKSMTNPMVAEFVWIPPGSFMMGSDNGRPDEKPVHRVTISEGFYMGKYEVTQAQWQAVMRNNPSHFKGDNLPVENVSWDDAIAFITQLNAQNDGHTYRLPTEAEWEYAARAGTTGNYGGELDAMAWYVNNSEGKTHPVGSKQPNAFGLYDMHGNVWEWVQDWYHESYAGAPTDGSAWLSGGEQKHRVLRGGSWIYVASNLRSSFRLRNSPDFRNLVNGLRLVAVARQ